MNAKRILLSTGLLAIVGLSTGCESMSNTAKDGLIGGGIGAGLGAAAGGGKGALIGGLAGTAIGGLIGNDADNQQKHAQQARVMAAEAQANAVQGPQVGITDVIQMTKQGQREDIIINQIRGTNSTFQLSMADISLLQENQVSPNVIAEMQTRRPMRVVQQQVVMPARYYYAPPPRPYIYYP